MRSLLVNGQNAVVIVFIVLSVSSLINLSCYGVEVTENGVTEDSVTSHIQKISTESYESSSDEELPSVTEEDNPTHKTRSVLTLQQDTRSTTKLEHTVLDTLMQAFDAISDEQCLRDVNRTLKGVGSRKWWAIASKFDDLKPYLMLDE